MLSAARERLGVTVIGTWWAHTCRVCAGTGPVIPIAQQYVPVSSRGNSQYGTGCVCHESRGAPMLHVIYSMRLCCVACCTLPHVVCMLHAACMLHAVCRMLWSRQVHRDDLPLQWRSCQVTPCYARAHGTRVCTHADWVSRRQHVRVACCSLPRFLRLYAACDVACCVPRVAGTSWMRTGNGRYRYARRRSFTLATDPPNARIHTFTHARALA
jgi:hypothetical protein